jgi:hypothetical protein|tara:strand:- start:149 stop:535 length:387 start_codon:yes stop_codon:yes gene_type:complete
VDQPGQKLTDFEELMWATGIFEGEGCISKRGTDKNGEKRFGITVKMTCKDIIQRFADCFELKAMGPYFPNEKKKDGSPKKPCYRADTQARDKIYEMVCLMYPYLGKKKRRDCDEFLKWYADKTHQRYD